MAGLGADALAAINLLCMSVREADLEAAAAAAAEGEGAGAAATAAAGAPGAGAGMSALYPSDAAGAALTSPLLALPPGTRAAVVAAKDALDGAAREAAAADAAVAAVARVLALRQAAALRARAAAGGAAGRLAQLVTALDGRYGWSRLAGGAAASFPGAAQAP